MGELQQTANEMVAPGRGILAADESSGTIKKRFDGIGVESTEDNRRAYREMLFTSKGLGDHISGVILFDETIRQSAADGTSFVDVLEAGRHDPRDQGGHRRQAARRVPGRDGDRGPGRPARAAAGVRGLGARFCQVARGDQHRAGAADGLGHPRERARAGAVRGAVPGVGAGADGRARDPDGRRPRRSTCTPRRPSGRSTPCTTNCSRSAWT